MRRVTVQIHFPELPEPMSGLWECFASHLEKHGCLHPVWHVSQRQERHYARATPGEVGEVIQRQGWTGFGITTRFLQKKEINFRLGPTYLKGGPRSTSGHSLMISYDEGALVPASWDDFIVSTLAQYPPYGATVLTTGYMAWQCSIYIDGYETRYGPVPPGFKRTVQKSMDGMGEDRILLDTSLNPGRYQIDDKNQFRAVAAELWLGEHFWDYAPCTKEEVLASDIFLEKRDTPHFLYLKSWPHPFTRPDGEQGRVQQKLWRLLFKEDCEWPPGSGGISDEPVGGPPELMP